MVWRKRGTAQRQIEKERETKQEGDGGWALPREVAKKKERVGGGGPFGAEPSIRAGGNMYAIIGFALMPLLWSLPECVMTYELSSSYPCDSGGVRFTEEAFGETTGLLVGYLGWISGVANTASLPSLLLSYVLSQFFPDVQSTDEDVVEHYGIMVCITLAFAYVNYRGLGVVGPAVIVIFFVSMTPFLLMVVIGLPRVDPRKWLQTPVPITSESSDDIPFTGRGWFPLVYPAGIAFRPFVNNLYWNFNGFDQASHYSRMVAKGTLRNGVGGSLVLVSLAYLLPIMIATGATDIEQDDWTNGSFAVAGSEIGGRWLGVSLLALFFSGMSADSIGIQGLADRGQLPSIFRHRSRHDTPTYALLLGVALILALLPLPFGTIIELANFTFCISVSIEFMSFVQLRIISGESAKFRKTLYSVMLILPFVYNITVMLTASYTTYIYAAIVAVFGVMIILARGHLIDEEVLQTRLDEMENARIIANLPILL
ncbi:hypothetical protein ACHAXA_007117 [Cyclostephanos tholiformis]|uniref:Amino acid transporter n=1 Tax=Cyclostephanos tholiformis TaxID=382380 RepID=A0ABD3RYH8_9STRA